MEFNENRINKILSLYYSRNDIGKAIFDFSEDRECIASYMMKYFGKRPDFFQYKSDILGQVKQGATSFHCSEELWDEPSEISTNLSRKELNNLRKGWDLLLDIDSPYLEYSKIYARLIVNLLKFHGIENVGVKYSGNKGFHIIVPWGAFPKEVYGMQTKDMFPEWPKLICQYLTETLREKLTDEILEKENLSEIAKKMGKKKEDLIITECLSCHRPVKLGNLVTWSCFNCKTERTMLQKNKRIPKCPDCKKELIEKLREKIYVCDFCGINSKSNPDMFSKTRAKTESLIEADLVLVSSRHLFRMPYSLHEKTALSSIVIDKDKIRDFQIKDANPFKVEIKNFYPKPKIDEAKELLLQVLDWKENQERKQNFLKEQSEAFFKSKRSLDPKKANSKKTNSKYQKILIDNPSDEIFPPCIKNLLKGRKDDGRKRALFILINFFKSLGLNEVELEKRINLWNDKNYQPLKKGYIQSQLNWYKKNTTRLPPNCDKSNYQDLNICHPDQLCRQIKNPLNYSVKRFFKNINKFK